MNGCESVSQLPSTQITTTKGFYSCIYLTKGRLPLVKLAAENVSASLFDGLAANSIDLQIRIFLLAGNAKGTSTNKE